MNHSKYLSQIGRKGGSAKGAAKSAAARKNGKRGGRPKMKANAELTGGSASRPVTGSDDE